VGKGKRGKIGGRKRDEVEGEKVIGAIGWSERE